jgi:hypothetical protein
MLISEQSFPHLRAAHDARLEQELERRRVARERLVEPAVVDVLGASPRRRRAWWQRSGERMLRGRAVAHPTCSGAARPA